MVKGDREWTHLKSDLFGRVEQGHSTEAEPSDAWPVDVVRRDTRRAPWWTRALAQYLAGREAKCLRAMESRMPELAGQSFPRVCAWKGGVLVRSWIAGDPMQKAKPTGALYHHELLCLLARLHRNGIAHNDLAKEPNLLVRDDGKPAIIDLQLGRVFQRRGAYFRLLAREDLRHLLKHKRTYLPQKLSQREKDILSKPSFPARLWRRTGKRVYIWITRSVFGWSDREGAGDRNLR